MGADSIQRSAAARLVRIARCAVAEAEVHAIEWLIGKECPPPRLYGSSQVGGGRKQRADKAAERVCAELSATALATGCVATVPRVCARERDARVRARSLFCEFGAARKITD